MSNQVFDFAQIEEDLDFQDEFKNPRDRLDYNNQLYSRVFNEYLLVPEYKKPEYRIKLCLIKLSSQEIQTQLNNPEETA